MERTDNDSFSPYRYGIDRGWVFGVYFAAMFFTWAGASQMPVLVMLTVALAVFFPCMVYMLLRRLYLAHRGNIQVTTLWISGISAIVCGSLICAALMMVYFKWINPTFLIDQLQQMVELYRTTGDPSLAEAARLSEQMIEYHHVPPASTWTLAMWLFTVSSASLLAGLMAVLARARGVDGKRTLWPGRKL